MRARGIRIAQHLLCTTYIGAVLASSLDQALDDAYSGVRDAALARGTNLKQGGALATGSGH